MADDPHNRAPSDPESTPSDLWQGLPLELDGDRTEEVTPSSSQVTVVQVVHPTPDAIAAASRSGRLFGALLLWTGVVALAFALAALATAALHGTHPVGWRGPLLTFDAAVIVLVLYGIVAAGAPLGRVSRRFVGGLGLAIAGAVVLGTLLHAADLFIHGAPSAALMREVSAFGLLGLAGCVVFIECLRDRGWACRTVVAATAAFVPLAVFGTGPRFELFAAHDAAALWLLRGHAPALVACGLCGAGLVVSWMALGAGTRRSRLRKPLAVAWLVMLLAAAAFTAFVTARTLGVRAACLRLWVAAAAWCVPPLAALVIAGMASCWRRRSAAGADALHATGFAWQVVAAGGLVLLALGLHAHGWMGGLEPLLMAGGAAAALTVAWLATARGTWTGRWALLPVGGAAVGAASALGALLDLGRSMGVGRAEVWNLGAAYLWCLVVVGLALASCGVLVARRHARAAHPARALQEDVALLTTAGSIFSATYLAVVFALWLGGPGTVAGLRAAMAAGAGLLRDLATLGNGRVLWDAAGRLARAALSVAALSVLVGMGAVAVLVAHVMARSGVRWALWTVTVLWCAALAVGSAFCVLYATGLFLPLPVPGLTTAVGRTLASHFAVRLAVMVMMAGLLARFWQAAVSTVRSASTSQRAMLPTWPHRPGWGSPHLRFLVTGGIISSAAGLAVVVLIDLHPRTEALLFEWTHLARDWGAAAMVLGFRVAHASRAELPCAVAVGAIAYALLMVHEEARSGRPAVYPVVATLWLGLLAPLAARLAADAFALPRPAMPGRVTAMAVAAVLVLVLAAGAVALLVRWWRLRRDGNLDEPDQSPSAAVSLAAAQSLGTLGLVLTLAGCLVVLHSALAGLAGYGRFAARLGESAAGLQRLAALRVAEAELFLSERSDTRFAALALGAAALLLLLLHAVARYRIFLARSAVYSVWFIATVVGLVGVGLVAGGHPPGTWSAGRILVCLALAALIVRAGIALASPGEWLVQRSDRFR